MIKTICRWWNKPACWWEFWLPSSGLRGGVIAGVIILVLFCTTGCACMGPDNDTQACTVAKRVVLTSALLTASAVIGHSCFDHDRRGDDHVHLPQSPNCSTGVCK